MRRPLTPLLCLVLGTLSVAPLLNGCAVIRGPVDPTRLALAAGELPNAGPAEPSLSMMSASSSEPPSSDAQLRLAPELAPSPPPASYAVPVPDVDAGRPVKTQQGIASFYASRFHGRRTANGEVYDETTLSAAHRTLPFGTRVRVTNLGNDRSVVLTINDRGPFVGDRLIDLSREAARQLGFWQQGLARVRLEVLQPSKLASSLP